MPCSIVNAERRYRETDTATIRGEFDGIGEQVIQYLAYFPFIHAHLHYFWIVPQVHLQLAPGSFFSDHFQSAVQQGGKHHRLRLEILLAGLDLAQVEKVVYQPGQSPALLGDDGQVLVDLRGAPGLVRFRWPGVGACEVRDGREIAVDPAPGVDADLLSTYLLGPALGVLLHQRGGLVLHASAVTVGGGCVAFLADAGWGKSTLAATLCVILPLVLTSVLGNALMAFMGIGVKVATLPVIALVWIAGRRLDIAEERAGAMRKCEA